MTDAKVKVTKEIAEAIEQLRKSRSDEEIFYHATSLVLNLDRFKRENKSAIRTLHGISPLKLATALAVGYEIEKTPAEKVAYCYKTERLFSCATDSIYERGVAIGVMKGIEFVVEAYGLKIEGVNV